jgi:hypothetical protein
MCVVFKQFFSHIFMNRVSVSVLVILFTVEVLFVTPSLQPPSQLTNKSTI